MARWVGRRMPRREDAELLTGQGRFVGDLHRPGMLHAAFLRSPFPHAKITSIDADGARAMPGVHAVLSGSDLPDDLGAQPNTHLFGERETPYYALARDRARYAGEPVAMVVAESPYLAEDARDEVLVDWEPLPSVGDAELALKEGAPLVWPDRDWPDNVCATFEKEMGDVDRAFAEADVVVTERYRIQRQFACSLEGRGVLAEWDRNVDELTLWTSSQIVHIVRDLLSAVLGLPEHRIRVLVPRIGGGFGAKFHFYNEETAVALAARATGRPVRWVEDRLESFVATVHARQQHVEFSMAAREDGTITGVKGDLIGDMGAAMHTVGYGPLWLTSVMLTSVYEIPNARVRARAVVTNKTPLGSYRGWGQPQANFVVERTVDRLAKELGIDRADLRRRNFIPPDRLPRKSLHHTLDSGDYRACLDRAMELVDERRWPERQAELREQGRHVGIGISFYTENSALGPSRMLNEGGVQQGGYDIARVRVEPGGEVTLYTGLCEMGQGVTTALAQVCADNVGVHPDQVHVVHGDSSQVPYTGYGTGASRGASVGGAAVMKAARAAREKVLRIAGHMLEASPEDLEAEDGRIFVRGTPSAQVTMADIGRAAYIRAIELPEGEDPGIETVEAFDPPQFAWPYGANVAVVEVDVETGEVSFLDYIYVHDCGTIVNPTIVEGQIQGGVAQGIGAALFEALPYDDDGQPLFATFMEYVLPTAAELPRLAMEHQHTPSPNIPGGMKGVGEAGAIGSPSAVVAAIEDALEPYGARITETPVTPAAIVEMVTRTELAGV
ncbi:MAG TPA: xanthine dehydrogenase family protein molybdopterin-binding subunit [Thermoleophilaceae bacterium]|nr:xanthine dehydrogenase family protein molybdopterin-binding subunit [Thermoleophilaceae bacterium]